MFAFRSALMYWKALFKYGTDRDSSQLWWFLSKGWNELKHRAVIKSLAEED